MIDSKTILKFLIALAMCTLSYIIQNIVASVFLGVVIYYLWKIIDLNE